MTMTSDAKAQLSSTIRGLRAYLLGDPANPNDRGALHDAVESTYRLAVRARDAGLSEAARIKRARLEAWAREQARANGLGTDGKPRTEADHIREAEKQAAYTLLNRIVILRLLEVAGFRKPAVVTSGWQSNAHLAFRDIAQALVQDDETEGYAFLLQLVFEDLAVDLPGIYGPVGAADLIPISAPVLKQVIKELDNPLLTSCWSDDMTLGWIYQYWNDPEREAIDAKLNTGGKVERHEIASKTQIFTERYMVDWLLQNSLGPMWLAMCQKHGWTPEVEANRTLARLDARRAEWRRKRDTGEVTLTELMPLDTDEERRWAYYVPQSIPDDAVAHAPESVRDLKILDPAVGSGHFLVVAFDLLVALYREEARHRDEAGEERWGDRAIVERILEHNLYGLDIDHRAVQIAAAALWLKARKTCIDAHPRSLNLVASNLRLGSLSDDDEALVELRRDVERETGMPAALTDKIVHALKGADHLGSLLKVDAAVDAAIEAYDAELAKTLPAQIGLYEETPEPRPDAPSRAEVKTSLLDRLEGFLARHSGGDDLGLRLRGEQLATGVRFVRLMRERQYDLVVGNPPYQAVADLTDSHYLLEQYSIASNDLFAAFVIRSLDLCQSGGITSLLTMRTWMFLPKYAAFRNYLLVEHALAVLGDFDRGAFEEVLDEVVAVSATVWRSRGLGYTMSVAIQPTSLDDESRDKARTARKRAAVLRHEGRYEFFTNALRELDGAPIAYWWSAIEIQKYKESSKLGDSALCREGLGTKNDPRYLRFWWEVAGYNVFVSRHPLTSLPNWKAYKWIPFVKGAAGKEWFEPLEWIINWERNGLEVATYAKSRYGRGAVEYFRAGVAVKTIGRRFSTRAHRYASIFGHAGTSVFSDELSIPELVTQMNRSAAQRVVSWLSPAAGFKITDVKRLPLYRQDDAEEVFTHLLTSFDAHEVCRETSVEFRLPGPSTWTSAQRWARVVVDRSHGAPVARFEAAVESESATDHLSFALGVALGRFEPNGEGIRDPRSVYEGGDDLSFALPHGILFLDGTLDSIDKRDGLGHPAAARLREAWEEYGPAIESGHDNVRDWLRLDFFRDVHRQMYESRPIHWPLSSANKTFVAWINIHRWDENTLRVLQADPLNDAMKRLDGELNDLSAVKQSADKKAANAAERRFAKVQKWRDELRAFVDDVERCAEKGPPPANAKCPQREVDARFVPDLDDGVMINSAALWPLLEPQWKDPKKWWKELATAEGKKDYDWSHLAMRYWPTRVDKKCQTDPSLGVAHGCFWKYYPARAWAWELRLQDEIDPDFRIEEAPYRGDGGDAEHRAIFLRDHAEEALAIVEKEVRRRRLKQKQAQPELRIIEPGLWSEVPQLCWDKELRVIEKQCTDFKLLSPDEPEARATFEAANPAKVRGRRKRLKDLRYRLPLYDPEDVEEQDNDEDDDFTEEADE